jgi:hypothetical protein
MVLQKLNSVGRDDYRIVYAKKFIEYGELQNVCLPHQPGLSASFLFSAILSYGSLELSFQLPPHNFTPFFKMPNPSLESPKEMKSIFLKSYHSVRPLMFLSSLCVLLG